jgi:thymidine phosphorylase
MSGFVFSEVVSKTRHRNELTAAEINWLVSAYLDGSVSDAQMAAWLMAVCTTGLSLGETSALTSAYIESGARLDWSSLGVPTCDKHSTGGVGDKISLILAPLVACFGIAVPMISGRALGHTGGTLDKLEAIPGFSSQLSVQKMHDILASTGVFIAAASAELAPADRHLYALRDSTGTVESQALIAASIMSKKLAEGVSSLVLDVKVGSGAFMRSVKQAKELAGLMVALGAHAGVPTRAVLTSMSSPLGFTAGNALEVHESLDVLRGGGPNDILELVKVLAEEMVEAAGVQITGSVLDPLYDGRAAQKFDEMVRAQGGNLNTGLPAPGSVHVLRAPRSGVLWSMDALRVGQAAWRLGAGRSLPSDSVDATAGVRWFHKPGDLVVKDEPLFELHTSTESRIEAALPMLSGAVEFSDDMPNVESLVHSVLRT